MASVTVSFKFLNHASFLICANSVRLVTDPWFESSVFNNGWSLLYEDETMNLQSLYPTDIWLSHEHPDHFNTATLLRIPRELRSGITIHIRQTKDGRVGSWCEDKGFKVGKNSAGKAVVLGADIKLTIYPIGIEDSASLIEVGSIKVLNLNDCLFFSQKSIHKFAEKVGNVDYVLYLCGYAEGGGTKVDASFREQLQKIYMMRFEQMKEAFPTAKIVGFAAFKHFSHIENQFQNDNISFRYIRDLIAKEPNTYRLIAPGDELTEVSPTQSLEACDFWEDRLRSAKPVTLLSTQIDKDVLGEKAKVLANQIRSIGQAWLYIAFRLPARIGLRSLEFHVVDHNAILKLSLFGESAQWTQVSPSIELDRKIRVTSSALGQALSYEVGLSTLLINGRFEANNKERRQLHRWSVLSLLVAAGEKLNLRYFLANAVRIARNL